MLLRGVPASLERENTRLIAGLRSGLFRRGTEGGTALVLEEMRGGMSEVVGVIVVVETGLKGTDSNLGASSLFICAGGSGEGEGEGGNLKLEGGILEACGILPDVVCACVRRGGCAAPLPMEACRTCTDGLSEVDLSQGNSCGVALDAASGDGAVLYTP